MSDKIKVAFFIPAGGFEEQMIEKYIKILKKKLRECLTSIVRYGKDTAMINVIDAMVKVNPSVTILFGESILKIMDPDRTIFQDRKISMIDKDIFIPIVDYTAMDKVCDGIVKVVENINGRS